MHNFVTFKRCLKAFKCIHTLRNVTWENAAILDEYLTIAMEI